MKNCILLLVLLSGLNFNPVVYAQFQLDQVGTHQHRNKSEVILPFDSTGYFVVRNNQGVFERRAIIEGYQGGEKFAEIRLDKLEIEGYSFRCELVQIEKKKLFVFFSITHLNVRKIYLQELSLKLEPIGIPEKIFSHETNQWGMAVNSSISLHRSQNLAHTAVVLREQRSKSRAARYKYLLFKNNMHERVTGQLKSTVPGEQVQFESVQLTNDGSLSVFISQFNSTAPNSSSLQWFLANDSVTEFVQDFNGRWIESIAIQSSDLGIHFTSIYGRGNLLGGQGIYYGRWNADSHQMEDTSTVMFSEELMTEGWTAGQLKRRDNRKQRGTERPIALHNYNINDFFIQDGRSTAVIEQYSLSVDEDLDEDCPEDPDYHYSYGAILLFTEDGNENTQLLKILKNQISTNDNGYYGSIACMLDSNKLHLFFNDHQDNYNRDTRVFDPPVRLPQIQTTWDKGPLATCVIDLPSGEYTRNLIQSDSGLLHGFVPQRFSRTTDSRTFYMWNRRGHVENLFEFRLKEN